MQSPALGCTLLATPRQQISHYCSRGIHILVRKASSGSSTFHPQPGDRAVYFFGFFLISSSLSACNMILLTLLGTAPEWPFDQSYETAYAKMLPVLLNAVQVIGPGAASNAIKRRKILRDAQVGKPVLTF